MRIAIPNKGRLKDPAMQFIMSVGIRPLAGDDRSLMIPTSWDNTELVMVRTEDIPNIVEAGAAELGVTGMDYVKEAGANVEELVKLDFGRSRIVLAVPSSWGIETLEDLKDREIRIATKYFNIAKSYLNEKGIKGRLVKISGAAEVMPLLGAADCIIDVMSTGTTLRLHGLKPIDIVMESHASVIGNEGWMKGPESERINLLLTIMKGTINGKGKKMIFMNVEGKDLEMVISSLPAMLAPSVSKLGGKDAWEVMTVAEEKDIPEIISKVKNSGAKDIVILDIEKVIK
ncbi:ATP phosphoribosyltransferase [Sulfuracidifex metallicus]|uniref:ATP phosphoribosyltransferase n=1 Tax=Sulfuracidifex metallicus TaxID=47303 RepID=UPI0022737B47|nr:ATP phosphoribosyltransferase [Sulfuracidifex metallicus]MCY0849946.1 ATP phosphoribosyltransferase [Sulfuracidifex metallicus]